MQCNTIQYYAAQFTLPYPTQYYTTLRPPLLYPTTSHHTLLLSLHPILYHTILLFFPFLSSHSFLSLIVHSISFSLSFPFLLSPSYSSHFILHIPSLTLYLFPITPRTSSVCLSPRSPCQHTSRTIVLPLDCKRERLKSKRKVRERQRAVLSVIEGERGRRRGRAVAVVVTVRAILLPLQRSIPITVPILLPIFKPPSIPIPIPPSTTTTMAVNQITSNQSQL